MESCTCPCGAALTGKDKMGSESYVCPSCHKTFRPADAKRQAREESVGSNPVAQWEFAKGLLIGVAVGGLVVVIKGPLPLSMRP